MNKNILNIVSLSFVAVLLGVLFWKSDELVFAGDPFIVTSYLFNTDAGVGDVSTPNSFAQVSYYRTQYNALEEIQVHDDVVNANFPTTAYSMFDVGSWWDSPDINNTATEVMAVFQVRDGLNGWSGPSYVAGVKKITVVNSGGSNFGRSTLEAVPTPILQSKTEDSITIGWTGLHDSNFGPNPGTLTVHDSIESYSLYRSVNGGAYQAHGSPFAVIAQNRAADITYTDNAISPGNTYRYKLTVNFRWPGKTGTQKYLESTAEGPESESLSLTPPVDHFDFVIASPQEMDVPFSGINTLIAKDASNNTITEFADDVTITENASLGTVSGLGGIGNVLSGASFSNGEANLTGAMRYGGTHGTVQFKATSGAVSSLSNQVTINQGTFARLGVNLNTPHSNAVPFTIANVSAQDIYGNILTNFDTIGENVTITVDGVGSINVTSIDRSAFIAGVANLTTQAFTFTGQAGSHVFTVTAEGGSVTATKTAQINPGAVTSVKIMNGTGGGATEVGTANVSVDTPVMFYAAGYDVSGNFVSNATPGNWTSSGFEPSDTFAQVSVTDASQITFAPRKVPSTGILSFDAGSGMSDSTELVTVVAGTATSFSVIAPATATAGIPISMTAINALDRFGNTATEYTGEQTLAVSGASNGPESGTPTTSITASFDTGVAATSSPLTLVAAETLALTLTQGAVSGQSNSIVVTAATPNHLHATAPANATAGSEFLVTAIIAHDSYGNTASSYAETHQISCGSLAGHESPGGTVPQCVGTEISFSNGIATTSLPVTLYKRESLAIPITDGTLLGATGQIDVAAAVTSLITKISGDSQSAPVNTVLAQPLVVEAQDAYGNLKNNQTVQFVTISGGGSFTIGSPQTDTNGRASANWRVGTTAGESNNTAEARVSGATNSPLVFTASATPAVATSFEVTVPPAVTAGVGFEITLTARDSLGNVDSSFQGTKNVSFSNPGAGPVSGAPTYPATADFNEGVATATISLVRAEEVTLRVVSGALSGNSAIVTVSPGPTATFLVSAPTTVTVNTPFALTAINSADQFGNATTDYAGTKTLAYSGPSGNAAYTTSVDFANGTAVTVLATTLVTIQQTAITVTEGSVSGTSNQMNVISPEPYYLEYVSGNNQSGEVGTLLGQPLIIAVRDQYGLLAANQTIQFTPSAGSVSPTSAITGADGLAQANWTLGTAASLQTVVASLSGISTTITFTATATVGQVNGLNFSSAPQTVRINAVSSVLSVCLQDQYGNSAVAPSDVTLELSSSSETPLFAVAIDGPWGITEALITPGTSCATVYYKDSTTGSFNLAASAIDLTSDTQSITIIANDLVRLEVDPSEFSISQNETQQMTATVYNQNDEPETSVTIVWSMADDAAGAISQSGLFYPSKIAASYPNAVRATVGSLTAHATPTITDGTTGPTPTPNPSATPYPSPTPIYISTSSAAAATNTTTNISNTTSNTTSNSTSNTTASNPTATNHYSIIVINNYYLGSADIQAVGSPITIERSGFPVILSPKQNSLLADENITISGTASPGRSIIINDADDRVIGTTTSDNVGNWKIILDHGQLSDNTVQLTASVHGTSMSSAPTTFYVKEDGWIEKLVHLLSTGNYSRI